MVGDEQIRTPCDGLIDNAVGWVRGERDACDRLPQVAYDKPRLIPAFRVSQRVKRFQYVNNLLEPHGLSFLMVSMLLHRHTPVLDARLPGAARIQRSRLRAAPGNCFV